eukprot:853526-Pelagomonas_calceolata.AAC.4
MRKLTELLSSPVPLPIDAPYQYATPEPPTHPTLNQTMHSFSRKPKILGKSSLCPAASVILCKLGTFCCQSFVRCRPPNRWQVKPPSAARVLSGADLHPRPIATSHCTKFPANLVAWDIISVPGVSRAKTDARRQHAWLNDR